MVSELKAVTFKSWGDALGTVQMKKEHDECIMDITTDHLLL